MNALRLRPSTDDDVEDLLDLTQRAHRAVRDEPHPMTLERMRTLRTSPRRDPGLDTPVVVRDGRCVGYASVFAVEPFSEVFAMVVADPDLDDDDFRRVVALLVQNAELRGHARSAHLPPDPASVLAVSSPREDGRLASAYAGLGFAVDRHGLEMSIDLTGRDLPSPVWPVGVAARRLRVPEDADAVTAVLAESFLDHQGDLPFTPELMRYVLAAADCRPDVSALAVDSDGPVGVVVCRDRPGHGYVWVLGVLRRGRRRGLATALLAHAFREYAAAGTTVVRLDVEESSLTGATRVYERAGMSVHSVDDTWTRPLHRS